MQAYVDGKRIESRAKTSPFWTNMIDRDTDYCTPSWNFHEAEYRIVPEPRVIYVNEYPAGSGFNTFNAYADESTARLSSCAESAVRIAAKYIEVIE